MFNSRSLLLDQEKLKIRRGGDDAASYYGDQTDRMSVSSAGRDSIEGIKVAEKEQKEVRLSKALVVVVLLLSMSILASITYWLLSQHEEENFRTQFKNYASEITAVSQQNVNNTFGTIESFSSTITSIAKDTNQEWPFVTIPSFEALGRRARELIGAVFIIMAPVVTEENRLNFEAYNRKYVRPNMQRAIDYSGENFTLDDFDFKDTIVKLNVTSKTKYYHEGPGPYIVNWQRAPFYPSFIMVDMFSQKTIRDAYYTSSITKSPTLNFAFLVYGVYSQIIQPVYREIPNENTRGSEIVAILRVSIEWGTYFKNLLSDDHANGIIVVMEDVCGFKMTYQINGFEAVSLGLGDHHDPKYDDMEVRSDFLHIDRDINAELPPEYCLPELTLHIYPSDELRAEFKTNEATLYTIAVLAIFIFTSLVFVIYDITVGRRQRKVMDRIVKQDKIVSNFFPSTIKARLYGGGSSDGRSSSLPFQAFNVSSVLLDGNDFDNPDMFLERPLADLYLESTILFADIAGFTAWSSAREPSQVFMLLEGIYGGFDMIANRLKVFKVETVGDCYVAACGLPDPCKKHAVVMARFARACMYKFSILTQKLEVALGPDTGELELRVGIHSGQVTGGVLRGERSRFQLFGDTMNTAARVESTSFKSKIQISCVTAELLRQAGKGNWLVPREDRISVAGKGQMQMYWLETREETERREKEEEEGKYGKNDGSSSGDTPLTQKDESDDEGTDDFTEGNFLDIYEGSVSLSKLERLIEWNVDVMAQLLVQIMATRDNQAESLNYFEQAIGKGSTVLEEFQEIISLPKIGVEDLQKRKDPTSITLDPLVISQLRQFITAVASRYHNNSFHNFEHASHVVSSVRKLLTRIVSIDNNATDIEISDLLGHSYGITSDPLTQFAVIFSAIIHDMDHPGVPNTQLVKEQVPIATKYKEKSVAEQNSVDLAWDILMGPQYNELRGCIYSNEEELRRFRQLVVNVVMATDICDKELQALRKERWNKAFSEKAVQDDIDIDRKATIVIEHLIQASDVSHTMQHWKVYLKWNERFFMECYGAYRNGRAASDPSVGWYKGEIGFFDFYIIPLAKKLENCGVFGVSSHEYLNYALANREEWERKGEEVVQGYLEKYELKNSKSLSFEAPKE